MIDHPFVSIIVPVYNTEKYISCCLDSLLAQTENNIEILTVDDGSSDNSLDILHQYAERHPHIRVFAQKNAGPGAARNTALKHARGKYIMFCDSDDMYKSTMCEEMIHVMENNNDIDFAFCDTEEYKKEIQTSHIRKAGIIDISPDKYPEIAVGIWCFIFRRDVIEKYNIYFPTSFYGEDMAFASKYIFISRSFYALDKKLYILRARDDSLMHSLSIGCANPHIIGNLKALADMYSFLDGCRLTEVCRKSYLKVVERLTIGSFCYMSERDKKKAFVLLQKILLPFVGKLEDFRLLAMVAEGKERHFFRNIRAYNMSGTIKIKFLGLTWFKIKNKDNEQIYYFINIPVFKIKRTDGKRYHYILGIRIS